MMRHMRRARYWGIILIAVTTLTSIRVCGFEFTDWDDDINIWQNPLLNPPTWRHVAEFWSAPFLGLYIPVTYSVWSAVAAFAWIAEPDGWGNHLNPYLFHTLNFALHLACVLTVWRLLSRFVRAPWAAGIGAALFALHPLQVEAVAWATGAKDLLGTLLAMLGMLAYFSTAKSAEAEREMAPPPLRAMKAIRPPSAAVHLGALGLFVLAVLAKPSTVVAPIMLLLLHFWDGWSWRRRGLKWLLAWFAVALAGALITRAAQPMTPDLLARQPPLWFRPFVAADAMAFYLRKLAWPFGLCIDYGLTPQKLLDAGTWRWTWLLPAGVAIAMALVGAGRQIWIGAGIFVAGLVPVLGLTTYRFQIYFASVADRYVYPSMFGAALVLAHLLSRVDPRPARGRGVIAAVAMLLAILGALSFGQAGFWADGVTLYTHVLAINPDSYAAHQNRGTAEEHDGDLVDAEPDYRAAVEENPDALSARIVLARVQFALGHDAQGVATLAGAIRWQERLDPEKAQTPGSATIVARDDLDLANLAHQYHHPAQAKAILMQAVRFDPQNAEVRRQLVQLQKENEPAP